MFREVAKIIMAENKLNVNGAEESKKLTDEEIEKIIEEKYKDKNKLTKRFIFKSMRKYGLSYTYEDTNRINKNSEVIITCPKHGNFNISPGYFFSDRFRGCPHCYIPKTRCDLEIFKKKLELAHPDYEIIEGVTKYTGGTSKIKLHCKKHNIDFISPVPYVLNKDKACCPECEKEKTKETIRKKEEIRFIKDFKDNFPNYELIPNESGQYYISKYTYINIRCKIHPDDIISVTPDRLRRDIKDGIIPCEKCRKEANREKRFKDFVNKVEYLFGKDLFDFSVSEDEFIGIDYKIKVRCKKCGKIFETKPVYLLNGSGCTYCSNYGSVGENLVRSWLYTHNFDFEEEVSFPNSVIVGRTEKAGVRIDFCLNYNGINYWIEYEGLQHYRFSPPLHKVIDDFKNQVNRDNNVRNYCKLNNITLIEIPYLYDSMSSVSFVLEEIIINNKSPEEVITKVPKLLIEQTKEKRKKKGGSKDERI